MTEQSDSLTRFVVKGGKSLPQYNATEPPIIYGDPLEALWNTEDFSDSLLEWVQAKFPEAQPCQSDVARRIAASIYSPLYRDSASPYIGMAPNTGSAIQEMTDKVLRAIIPPLFERLNQ